MLIKFYVIFFVLCDQQLISLAKKAMFCIAVSYGQTMHNVPEEKLIHFLEDI